MSSKNYKHELFWLGLFSIHWWSNGGTVDKKQRINCKGKWGYLKRNTMLYVENILKFFCKQYPCENSHWQSTFQSFKNNASFSYKIFLRIHWIKNKIYLWGNILASWNMHQHISSEYRTKDIHEGIEVLRYISTGDSLVVEVAYPACPGPRDKVTPCLFQIFLKMLQQNKRKKLWKIRHFEAHCLI